MSNSVVYILELRDKFSQVAEQIQYKTIAMGYAFDKAAARMKVMGDKMQKAGKGIRGVGNDLKWVSATSGLLAINAVKDWGEAQAAMAKVDNALKATGGKAGLTLKQLTDESNRLMATSIFDDDIILAKSTNQLLKFGNVTGDVFMRAQQAAVDVASSTGKDLGAMSMIIGRALNSPAKGMMGLTKLGVAFTPVQQRVIKTLVKTGRASQAQAIILTQLEGKYKGMGEAAAKAGLGPVTQLNNSFGESKEIIGGLLATALLPLAAKLLDLSNKFQNASPMVQKIVTLFILFAAVIAPVLVGVGMLITAFGVLATVTWAATWPILAIIAIIVIVIATAWLLYDAWDDICFGISKAWDVVWNGIGASVNALVVMWEAFMAKISQGGKFVMEFLGINSATPTPQAAAGRAGANVANKGSKDTLDVTINAPEGTVKEVTQGGPKTTGKKQMNVGVNAVR